MAKVRDSNKKTMYGQCIGHVINMFILWGGIVSKHAPTRFNIFVSVGYWQVLCHWCMKCVMSRIVFQVARQLPCLLSPGYTCKNECKNTTVSWVFDFSLACTVHVLLTESAASSRSDTFQSLSGWVCQKIPYWNLLPLSQPPVLLYLTLDNFTLGTLLFSSPLLFLSVEIGLLVFTLQTLSWSTLLHLNFIFESNLCKQWWKLIGIFTRATIARPSGQAEQLPS